MSIIGSIWYNLKQDIREYLKTRIGRKIYRKYWLNKEAAKLAHQLSQDIDKQIEEFKKHREERQKNKS